MNRLLTAAVIAIALGLGAIAYELHALNARIDGVALGAYRAVAAAASYTPPPETPAQREERLDSEIIETDRHAQELKYRLTHDATGAARRQQARRSQPPAAPDPSVNKSSTQK